VDEVIRECAILAFAVLVFALLTGCAATGPKAVIDYELDPLTPSPQTKNNVTIKVGYIGPQHLSVYPQFTYVLTNQTKKFVFLGVKGQEVIVNPFKGLTGFAVEIKNHTGHILRMEDARIAFIFGGKPYFALTRSQLAGLLLKSDGEPSLESTFVMDPTVDFRLINEIGTEVLPGFAIEGFLAFPLTPGAAAEGELNFYDVTTKVDAAGDPLEKTLFTFKVKRAQIEIGSPMSENEKGEPEIEHPSPKRFFIVFGAIALTVGTISILSSI
jgi:hypothetical protein